MICFISLVLTYSKPFYQFNYSILGGECKNVVFQKHRACFCIIHPSILLKSQKLLHQDFTVRWQKKICHVQYINNINRFKNNNAEKICYKKIYCTRRYLSNRSVQKHPRFIRTIKIKYLKDLYNVNGRQSHKTNDFFVVV